MNMIKNSTLLSLLNKMAADFILPPRPEMLEEEFLFEAPKPHKMPMVSDQPPEGYIESLRDRFPKLKHKPVDTDDIPTAPPPAHKLMETVPPPHVLRRRKQLEEERFKEMLVDSSADSLSSKSFKNNDKLLKLCMKFEHKLKSI